ncbi:MAG: fructosamine kinase family protein [Gammaproteobacteria bacterium]|nr:MAG: fructosamine kinase family protein [Gammaproteobacteria bacterium]
MPDFWACVAARIGDAQGRRIAVMEAKGIGGGCINRTFTLRCDHSDYFVKLNHADSLGMFEAEAAGLRELCQAGVIRVPEPVCWGAQDENSFLVLEQLSFARAGTGSSGVLGRQLAELHRVTHSHFGWSRDNTIGSTPQQNSPHQDWPEFFKVNRLQFQLDLAKENGYGGTLQKLGTDLLTRVERFFSNHRPVASLLHGDLWGGNWAVCEDGTPVIFDPAVYYGDREADLAMTELFGGFDEGFYAAYREVWPLDQGYAERKSLYNLYHILNHLNLFGGGYLGQAESLMRRVLSFR